MTTYNVAPYVQVAISSILCQTFSDFELIVVDDGSSDDTVKRVASFSDPRIHLLQIPHRGLVGALNGGIALARGSYIARMDGDDISMPERFQKQIEFLAKNPGVGLVGTRYLMVDEHGRDVQMVVVPLENEQIKKALMYGNCIGHGTVMLRVSCLKKVGLYRAEAMVAEDYDLWCRVAEHYEIANLQDVLYKWRLRISSDSVRSIAISQYVADEIARRFRERRQHGIDRPLHIEAVPPKRYYKHASRMLSQFAGWLEGAGSIDQAMLFNDYALATNSLNLRAWMNRIRLKYQSSKHMNI